MEENSTLPSSSGTLVPDFLFVTLSLLPLRHNFFDTHTFFYFTVLLPQPVIL
jgi:hypothetical protein